MKKAVFYLMIVCCLAITTQKLNAQEVATIPYLLSSEEGILDEEKNQWVLKDNETNEWFFESDSLMMESSEVFYYYDYSDPGVCLAERKINLGDYDSLKVEFLGIMGGEGTNDFLKVFLVPLDTNWQAVSNTEIVPFMTGNTEYDLYFTNNIYNGLENKISETQGNEITYTTAWLRNIGKNQVYKLVFAWRTDRDDTNDPYHVRIGKISVTGKYATSGIDDVMQANTISIYPNPAKDVMTLDLGNLNNVEEITIINNAGQVVKVIKNVKNINVSDLESGVYYIKANNVVQKFVIE